MSPIVPEWVYFLHKFCIPWWLWGPRLREERVCPVSRDGCVGRVGQLLRDDCLYLLQGGPEFLFRHEASRHKVNQGPLVLVEPWLGWVE